MTLWGCRCRRARIRRLGRHRWHPRGHLALPEIAEPHHLLGEGLCLGLSSGINIAGAVRYAKEYGPGKTIVTILCDSGLKYESKIYNQEWLFDHDFDTELLLESVLA